MINYYYHKLEKCLERKHMSMSLAKVWRTGRHQPAPLQPLAPLHSNPLAYYFPYHPMCAVDRVTKANSIF